MAEPAWKTSTYCPNGNCIEVADSPTTVLVRDTKDHDAGTLTVRPAAWSAFLAVAKAA